MSNLTERANYLRGLADGLQINTEKSSNRLLLEVIDLLRETAEEIEDLRADHEELSDFVDAIDEDLGLLEEDVADLEESVEPLPELDNGPLDEADEDAQEEDDGEDEVTYHCPHCGEEVVLSIDGFDFDEDMECPHCGKPLFPETVDGDADDADDGDAEADEADEPEEGGADVLPDEDED